MAVFRLALILLVIGGAAAQVQLEPQNLAVLLGSQALFNCSTTPTKLAMTWSLNGIFVVSIQMENVVPLDPRFLAKTYNTSGIFKTELNISNVKRSDTGEVSCQFLGGPFGVSRLSVQERGSVDITGGNRTVIQGSQTEFQCQALGWSPEPNVSWTVNGVVVKICTNSSVAQGNVFNTSCTLTVTAAINSSVQCLVKVSSMSSPASSTVFLSVVYLRGSVAITGGNRTVIQGSQTEFQCQALGWSPEPNVSWTVNGVVVKICTNSSVAQGNVFNTSCTLTVTAAINSSVQCLVKVSSMSSPASSTVFLSVVYLRGSVAITGGNRTVIQGSQTEFQCQALGWSPEPNVSWTVNGVVVKICTNSSVAQGNVFNTSCTLTVTAAINSSVQCLVKVSSMSSPASSTVFLSVVYLRGSVAITGGNRTVIQGSQTEFQCQALGWSPEPNVSWTVNGVVVKICTNSSVAQGNVFNTSCTLTVTAAINSSVQCLVKVSSMSSPASSTVFLSVVYLRGSVAITGGNRTVIQGSKTEFQCQAFGWSPEPNVSWSVNGVVVKYCTNSSVAQGNVFNTICTLPVTAAINSSVQCLVKVSSMSSPDISTIFLTVGPKPRDYTILIAVTVAFSAAALLFLLIFGIFFFCRRRKKEKSGYEEEVRRARLQSQHMATITSDARGRDNRGYVTDGRYGGNHNGAVWNTDYSPKPQRSYPKDDFFDDGYKNHRHMTMV